MEYRLTIITTMLERNINTTLIEEVYEDSFNSIKQLLIKNLYKEIDRHINEQTVETFFEEMIQTKICLDEFIASTDIEKLELILNWFKGNSWTLSDAVFDFTRDDFEGSIPSVNIAYIERDVTNRQGKFIYAEIIKINNIE